MGRSPRRYVVHIMWNRTYFLPLFLIWMTVQCTAYTLDLNSRSFPIIISFGRSLYCSLFISMMLSQVELLKIKDIPFLWKLDRLQSFWWMTSHSTKQTNFRMTNMSHHYHVTSCDIIVWSCFTSSRDVSL